MKKFLAAAAAMVVLGWAGTASAAPAYCPGNPATLSVNDVTFRSNPADNCYGVVMGNVNDLTDVQNLFGVTWTNQLDQSSTLNDYLVLNWTLSNPGTGTSGSWTLTVSDPPPVSLPVTTDILVALKASDRWAAYYFAAETFTITGGNQGSFDIEFKNNGGQIPGLSHMTLFFGNGVACDDDCDSNIPEPASMLLLGAGLLGLAAQARRRR